MPRFAPWMTLLAVLLAHAAVAADYPTRPVRWLVGFAPGASNDITARVVAARLSDSFGQQVVVDNRAGAAGMIAGEITARAAPDGYTVLLSTGGPSINGPLLTRRAPYRVDDFTQIVTIGYTPFAIIAHPAFPPRNPRELIDYARAHPGKINWGSSGVGGSPHFGLLILQAATGIEVTHVPYKGSAPALVDMVAGNIQVMHSSIVSAEAHLAAKRLKVIGVTALTRLASHPDVQTFAEMGFKNAEGVVWFGMAGPPGLPRPIVQKLNAEVNRVLKSADSVKRLQDLGLETVGGTPEEATQWVKREAATLTRLIEQGRIKPE